MKWDLNLIGNVAFWVFTGGGLLTIAGVTMGKFLKANAQVDEDVQRYRDLEPPLRVLRDVNNPEAYPKTWAYRAERGAEETMELRGWGP